MRTSTFLLAIIAIIVVGAAFLSNVSFEVEENVVENSLEDNVIADTLPDIPIQYMGKISLSGMSVRMLILKHSPDDIANVDAKQAIQAANIAKSKGLSISDIGNFHIDSSGQTPMVDWMSVPLDGLKRFIGEQMKIGAQDGDTLIIYTIGHGSKDGSLQRVGQRAPFMNIIAEAAEENEQFTFWWQLSCYASAKLPSIDSLTPRQRNFLVIAASSTASKTSYFSTQGAQFEKMFVALAQKSSEIDPNQDGAITSKELKDFLNTQVEAGRGDLFWSADPDMIVFGWPNTANKIPIIESNGSEGKYPDGYIPSPVR